MTCFPWNCGWLILGDPGIYTDGKPRGHKPGKNTQSGWSDRDDSCKRIPYYQGACAAVWLFFFGLPGYTKNRGRSSSPIKKQATWVKMITAQVKVLQGRVLGFCDWWIGFGFGDAMGRLIESFSGYGFLQTGPY